jgi:FHS family glucose/mannose:H+ symporter-like MFS transporter
MSANEPTSAEVTFRSFAMASATTDLVVIGMMASLFGPLLLTFAHRFHLSLPDAGVVLSVYFVGGLIGVPIGWFMIRRLRGSVVLSAELLVMVVGACVAALATNWTMFLGAIFFLGLGFGGVDFALNSLLVRTREDGRGRRLSLANAGWGVGAVIGPLLIIVVHPHNFRYIYFGFAAIAVLLTFGNRGLLAPPLREEQRHNDHTNSPSRRRTILITFIGAYILYLAVETTTAGWIAPQLHRTGYSSSIGSITTAGFWLGLAIGRVLAGPVGARLSGRRTVLVGLIVAAALCAGAAISGAAPYLYPFVGLALALVYPLGLIWYAELCPHDGDGIALLILCMMAGGVIGPGVESLMVSTFGIHVVPLVLGGFALLDLAVFASALRFARPATYANA